MGRDDRGPKPDRHGKKEETKGQHHTPLAGRAGTSPRGPADKGPFTNRPPQGWGWKTGGPAGKHGPKDGKK